jgi:hypothetical protein
MFQLPMHCTQIFFRDSVQQLAKIIALAKIGSFGFAKGRLCVSGKTKCAVCAAG